MSKEIYIAGKVDCDENTIIELTKELEDRNHRINLKWWEGQKPLKPYLDYPENFQKAEEMINNAINCEVFILIANDGIMGAMTEFGAALSSKKDDVIVINKNERQSIFFTHPKVSVLDNVEEIKNRPWY